MVYRCLKIYRLKFSKAFNADLIKYIYIMKNNGKRCYYSQDEIIKRYSIPYRFINLYFGKPDVIESNNHHKYRPVKYYESGRVARIVKSMEFQNAVDKLNENRLLRSERLKKSSIKNE